MGQPDGKLAKAGNKVITGANDSAGMQGIWSTRVACTVVFGILQGLVIMLHRKSPLSSIRHAHSDSVPLTVSSQKGTCSVFAILRCGAGG